MAIITYNVADYLGLGGPLPGGDQIELADTAAALESLSVEQLSALEANGVVSINTLGDNKISLDLTRLEALKGVIFDANDEVRLLDEGTELRGALFDKLPAIVSAGVDILDSSDNTLRISYTSVSSLLTTGLNFSEEDLVSVDDSLKFEEGLTPQQITLLSDKGVDIIDADPIDDNFPSDIDLEMAKAIAASRLAYESDDWINLHDTGVNISQLSASDLAKLSNKGLDFIDSSDGQLALSLEQFDALASMELDPEDEVTLQVTSMQLAELSAGEIAALSGKNIDLLDAADGVFNFSVDQYEALGTVSLSASDILSLTDTGANLSALSTAQIAAFGAKGGHELNATDNRIALSLEQYNALGNVRLSATDTVTLLDVSTRFSDLTAAHIAALAAAGVDALDAADNKLTLSIDQYDALGTITLSASDSVGLSDTSTKLAGLTKIQLAALAQKGVNVLDATDNSLALSLDQYHALGSVKLSVSDAVSLSDTGARIAGLTVAEFSTLASKGIDVIDANDNQLTLSADQYNALGTTKLNASDSVTMLDAGAKLSALTVAQVSALALAGVDTLDATNNAYTLSLGQYRALSNVKLSASDVVTVVADADAVLSSGGNNLTLTGGAMRGTGNSLANTISGNAANNVLEGLEGNDFLIGGLGNDQLRGGAGKDAFVFDKRTNRSTNVDKVLDFKSADDSVHLDNAIFTKLGRGSAAGVKFKSDMFVEGKKAQDREDRIVYDKKTGALYYDQDGTGSKAQVKIATISNKTKLYYHDFFVI